MEVSVYKTQGIVLKKADLSDADRLLMIYTQKQGKIPVRARGIGKKESRLKSLIEPFNIYEFSLAKSKTTDILAGSYPIEEFVALRQNLENLALAIYFAELADRLISAPERDDKIWALLVRAFEAMDENSKSPPTPFLQRGELLPLEEGGWEGFNKLKTAFEEKLLEFLGYPSFAARGKSSERERQAYLWSLAGESVKTAEFLSRLTNL